MPNTITTYHSFAPNTPARSSEVNTNFNNYRGTILPINSDTATSSDNTHDLGSTEHRWRSGYFGSTLTADTEVNAAGKALPFNYVISSGCGSFLTTTTNEVTITALKCTLTSIGRPVKIEFIPESTGDTFSGFAFGGVNSTYNLDIRIYRDSTVINKASVSTLQYASTLYWPACIANTYHVPTAGSYVYTISIRNPGGVAAPIGAQRIKMLVYEI